jgi:putative CocE/NonD family hydrolase
MRDGIGLATDLHFPDSGDSPFDAILIRTPYDRNAQSRWVQAFTGRGYLVAVQSVRGQGESEGDWSLFGFSEKDDGYDAVEWLADQEWSTGKVGMIGGSYVGWTTLWAAVAKPPHLVTVVSNVTPSEPFRGAAYHNGLLGLGNLDIIGQYAGRPRRTEAQFFAEARERLFHLPVSDLDRVIHGQELEGWRQLVSHNTSDAFWEASNYLESLEDIEIPIFIRGGWFDNANPGTRHNYVHANRSGSGPVKLLIGPWAHSAEASRSSGGMDFGETAAVDLDDLYGRWFDHWMRGIDTGLLEEPLVRVFVIGENRWIEGPAYPLPQTVPLELRLSSGGTALGVTSGGKLSSGERPQGAEFDSFVYDPADPTPSLWHGSLVPYPATLDERQDILVYESDPLMDGITIAGPVSLRLFASTSGADTDWVAYWRVIHPATGQPALLGGGALRARFRDSFQEPTLLEGGEVVEYTLDLGDFGVQLPPGAVIRLEIASAAFPRFSRNLNTGGHNEMETGFVPANQKIYHSERYPSALILPLIVENPTSAGQGGIR